MSFKTNVFAEENDRNCECKQGSQRMCRSRVHLMCVCDEEKRKEEKKEEEGSTY